MQSRGTLSPGRAGTLVLSRATRLNWFRSRVLLGNDRRLWKRIGLGLGRPGAMCRVGRGAVKRGVGSCVVQSLC